jgi:hypothetical protein
MQVSKWGNSLAIRFNNSNTSVTSSAFGQVTSQKGYPRRIQFGFKFLF